MDELVIEPLTRAAFQPFGEVLDRDGAEVRIINDGTTRRYHALSRLDTRDDGRPAIVSIFSARRRAFPLAITMLERHPFGSQCFFPLTPFDWLVVVGTAMPAGRRPRLRGFRARGDQGVTYAPNVWHHPLLVLEDEQDFLVVDRDSPETNCEELHFADAPVILRPA